jgi:hypothetical protein
VFLALIKPVDKKDGFFNRTPSNMVQVAPSSIPGFLVAVRVEDLTSVCVRVTFGEVCVVPTIPNTVEKE